MWIGCGPGAFAKQVLLDGENLRCKHLLNARYARVEEILGLVRLAIRLSAGTPDRPQWAHFTELAELGRCGLVAATAQETLDALGP